MKVTVLDDFQGVVRRLEAIDELAGLPVELDVRTDHVEGETLIAALRETDCVVLIRERTQLTADVIAALPQLKLVVQTGRQAGSRPSGKPSECRCLRTGARERALWPMRRDTRSSKTGVRFLARSTC